MALAAQMRRGLPGWFRHRALGRLTVVAITAIAVDAVLRFLCASTAQYAWLCSTNVPAASPHSHLQVAPTVGSSAIIRHRTARAASTLEDITILPKGAKIRETTNPQMKRLLSVVEYDQVVDWLLTLKRKGLLGPFLREAQSIWVGVDLKDLSERQDENPKAIVEELRNVWERAWPSDLDRERDVAFTAFVGFWRRVERSRIFDELVDEILPGLGRDTPAAIEQERLFKTMDEEERMGEIRLRLESSKLGKQYVELSKDNSKVQEIASDMIPFLASVMSVTHSKLSDQVISFGGVINVVLALAAVAAVWAILALTGFVKLPFSSEEILPPATEPTEFAITSI